MGTHLRGVKYLDHDLTVLPLRPLIGAEVCGVDLAQPLTPELRDTLREFLLHYKVLFFRGQALSRASHVALGRAFGALEVHPLREEDYPEILRLDSHARQADGAYGDDADAHWHADTTFRRIPAAAAILRGVTIPDAGGDTVWTNTAAAYAGLPEAVKVRLRGLRAMHSAVRGFAPLLAADSDERRSIEDRHPPVEHPVVHRHPVTGEETLFVNPVFTTHIVGLPPEESAELLRFLFAEIARPDYQVRFSWRPNSVAFWDNRATQHRVVRDFGTARRVVERVTIAGSQPL